MAYAGAGVFIDAPQIQGWLDDFFACDRTQIVERMSLLNVLNDPNNGGNARYEFRDVMIQGEKRREVLLKYQPRKLVSEVGTDCDIVCESTNEEGDYSTPYEFTGSCVSDNFLVPVVKLRKSGENVQDYIARQMLRSFSAMDRKMAAAVALQLETYVGKFAAGEDNVEETGFIKSIATRKENGDIDSEGIADIKYALMNAEYCENPILFGHGPEPTKYFMKLDAGCCSNEGINIGELYNANGYVYVDDKYVGAQFGADTIIAVSPGSLKLVYDNDFIGPDGIYTLDEPDLKNLVVYSPYSNAPYDMVWKRSDCGQNIVIALKAKFQLFGQPTDMFKVGDPLAGTTGVNEFLIENPVAA